MNDTTTVRLEQPEEQLRYARWLEWGTRMGMAVLVLSFAAYVTGWLPSAVPPDQLSSLWGQPVAHYLQQTGAPTGWAWIRQLNRGDVASLAGIAILAGLSMPALLALVPAAWRRRDRAMAALCLAEVAVIAVAATGWLTAGH